VFAYFVSSSLFKLLWLRSLDASLRWHDIIDIYGHASAGWHPGKRSVKYPKII